MTEELTRAEIDDWLAAHDMAILACHHDYVREGVLGMLAVWLYHRDTQRGNWANWQFIRRIANFDADTNRYLL